MRIFARGSPGCSCHSGIGAGWSSVYTPCLMRMPSSVPERLFPMDQLSSGVVIVMFAPYRSAMILPLYVTTKAAVIPAGSNAASSAASTLALSTPAGHGSFDGLSPIGHASDAAGGSALFTTSGLNSGSVFPTGSATQPWLSICFASRTVPFGIVTATERFALSIFTALKSARDSYGAVK